jgi:hypothetical protein
VYGLAGGPLTRGRCSRSSCASGRGRSTSRRTTSPPSTSGLGETDRAFEWLQKACDERAAALMNLKVDPALDSLRSDRRFAALLACTGLS